MTINFALCDDEHIEIIYIAAFVRKWAVEHGIDVRILEFESAESFLFAYEDNKSIDILLLDIQMKRMDGVELAHQIRKVDENIQIVFITGYPDFIAEGYDVSALHYLMKPVKEEKLFEVLEKALHHIKKTQKTITFPKTGGDVKLKVDDIIYAEVLSHTVVLYLINGKEEFSMRISDMEKLLGNGFIKCHRSYIVSMKYVKRVTKTAVILNDNREIPLSRNLYDAANQAFISYN